MTILPDDCRGVRYVFSNSYAAVRMEPKEHAIRAVRISAHRCSVRRVVVLNRRPGLCRSSVRAAGFCLVPVLVTGGIHLDGFADTYDALSSYGDAEKKLEILKDPHCGAFAVIRLCTYFILYFALCASVKFTVRFGVIWILALTLERAFSGLAVASFPMAKNTGLAHTFAEAADRITVRRVLIIYTVVLGAAMLVLGGWAAVLALYLSFGGITQCRKSNSAASRATLPGGSCKGQSSPCWQRSPCASGEEFCNAVHHRSALQRQAHVREKARRYMLF